MLTDPTHTLSLSLAGRGDLRTPSHQPYSRSISYSSSPDAGIESV
jgi:hypothetical protein